MLMGGKDNRNQIHIVYVLYHFLIKNRRLLLAILVVSCFFVVPLRAQAAACPGTLIQTTTNRDEYEGIVYCDGFETDIVTGTEPEAAGDAVKKAIVGIRAGNYHGSGIIWEMDQRQIIIASSKHLLVYADGNSTITFLSGYEGRAKEILLSDEYDLGFMVMNIEDCDYDELLKLRRVRRDPEAEERLKAGSVLFNLGSADSVGGNYYSGTLLEKKRFIQEFDSVMLRILCYAKAGMSGGGTFDAEGNFLGLISGGNGGDETVSLPLLQMEEEFNQLF